MERNLAQAFRFNFARSDIRSVRRFAVAKPFVTHFTLPWVLIATSGLPGGPSDLLLAIGGNGMRMGALRRRNAEFADVLQTWHRGSLV
jgi:hypothetical protein